MELYEYNDNNVLSWYLIQNMSFLCVGARGPAKWNKTDIGGSWDLGESESRYYSLYFLISLTFSIMKKK